MKTLNTTILAIIIAAAGMLNTGCTDQSEEVTPVAESALAVDDAKTNDNGMTKAEVPFRAVALIADCFGENIAFSGIIENMVKTTVDGRGVMHYTRHFRTKGMTGVGQTTGTLFEVVGGAEMFNIQDVVFNANGTPNLAQSRIVIHQGTLVFVSQTDGTRVVARHIIRKVPGSDEMINKWECGGK